MKLIQLLTIVLITGGFFAGCQPEGFEPVGDPHDNIAPLAGTWKLTKVVQTDLESQRKGFPYAVEDITTLFDYATLQLTFNLNNGAPGNFTINNGSAPPITSITTGTWSVDNVKTPQVITLKNGTVTETLALGGYVNAVNSKLKVKITRADAATDKLLIAYDYEFSR